MAGNKTFSMIKPNAVKNEYTGEILSEITNAGFRIVALKMHKFSKTQAQAFYGVHKEKHFFNKLIDFMCSGPIVAMILEKENAVEEYRNFIGATNPENAAQETIRKKYGASIQMNAVHGSDSDKNAAIECDFFFSMSERYGVEGYEQLV